MNNEKFSADMTPEERHRQLIEMPDDEIDYSDIPPLTYEFWKNAELRRPEKKEGFYIKLSPHTQALFRRKGRGYQAMIDSVLTAYVEHQEKTKD